MNAPQRELAAAAFTAYNAMEVTKQRHFDLLTVLETKKKKFNIDPTPDDQSLLDALLQDHDRQVKTFTAEAASLKSSDPDTHKALFEYIGKINDVLGILKESH